MMLIAVPVQLGLALCPERRLILQSIGPMQGRSVSRHASRLEVRRLSSPTTASHCLGYRICLPVSRCRFP